MHQALRLEMLSLLPISLRRFASPAANGSLLDFKRLMAALSARKDMQVLTPCLPVFYANLDPATIPSEDHLFTLPVQQAVLALHGLQLLLNTEHEYTPPAAAELWQRIWPWVVFLDTCRDVILSSVPGADISFDLLLFIERLNFDSDARFLIEQTPDVRSLVAHAWIRLFDIPDGPPKWDGFASLRTFLYHDVAVDQPANLLELVDGCGGPAGFASLVIKTLRLFLAEKGTIMSEANVQFYDDFTAFLLDVSVGGWEEGGGIPVFDALISAGIITPVTAMIVAISDSPTIREKGREVDDEVDEDEDIDEDDEGQLLDAFRLLATLFESGSFKGIADAIAAGLLSAIIRASVRCMDTDNLESTDLWRIVVDMLPGALVYHPVVVQLESQIAEIERLATDSIFRASPIYKKWACFVQIGRDRVQLLNEYRAAGWAKHCACDNIEVGAIFPDSSRDFKFQPFQCGVIERKIEFKRCSRCQRVYYCSFECQKLDWTKGGHRDILTMGVENPHLDTRALGFMRALLEKDDFPEDDGRAYPGRLTVTVRNYVHGGALVGVYPLEDLRKEDKTNEVCWDECIANAARSGSRTTLHLMVVWDEGGDRFWMFTQHRDHDTPTVQDRLTKTLAKLRGMDMDPSLRMTYQ
ncbi:hypothetical protein B0H16DRAFT_1836687 [Mycena metata]|uniref:MYND-type domain-containing protein n=1 Tax=Mycena metata TaxID=1033252 RepID=A0AAD7IXK6_9AGAR|nr:hypothetical protein B0H16DRAFT_1836687 [Mycena metata]